MIKLTPIADIAPSTYNPRSADEGRLDLVELSLRKLGFVLPIVADENGEIISGHQRHLVAERMGLEQVPVAFLPAMEMPERKALNIVFNRGTNDMGVTDHSDTMTAQLEQAKVDRMADGLPDIEPFLQARCMDVVGSTPQSWPASAAIGTNPICGTWPASCTVALSSRCRSWQPNPAK